MQDPKLTFFFGAGAEVSYGLPSGGEFALEIFRIDNQTDKQAVKKELKKVHRPSTYSNWFPDDYLSRTITAFGKPQRESLLSSSLEHNRSSVLNFLKEIDEIADNLASTLSKSYSIDVATAINNAGGELGESQYGQLISIDSTLLQQNEIKLFDSKYFGALLHLLCRNEDLEQSRELREVARGLIEVLIGALGKELIQKLNDNLISNETNLNIFDDICGIFSIDYKKAGHDALSFILEQKSFDSRMQSSKPKSDSEVITAFYTRLLELLIIKILDYRSLIDSYFHYLYCPKKEFAKFSKISTFLYTVKRYISTCYDLHKEKITDKTGYYDDLANCSDIKIQCISTSNYNQLIKEKLNKEVLYLNGSTEDYYDPYRNKIVTKESNNFKVPFLFTQSGIKPITSIEMTMRYASLYKSIKESDAVVVCGFGFNTDDAHINGVLRAAVEDDDKKLILITLNSNNTTLQKEKDKLKKNLRLKSDKNLSIILVDSERKENGQLWLKSLLSQLSLD